LVDGWIMQWFPGLPPDQWDNIDLERVLSALEARGLYENARDVQRWKEGKLTARQIEHVDKSLLIEIVRLMKVYDKSSD